MRITANLQTRLERNLMAYATAATAAGVGMLSVSQSMEAKVVYTPAHVVIGSGGAGIYNLDLNHDQLPDFALKYSYYCDYYGCTTSLRVSGGYVKCLHAGGWAEALHQGAKISSMQTPFFVRGYFVRNGGGPWVNVKNRYLGMKFKIDGQFHFGWARLSVSVNGNQISATLTGYAYETIPDKAIIAGTRGSTSGRGPEPKPVNLGHLALGAGRRQAVGIRH